MLRRWPRRRVIENCVHSKGPLLVRYFLLHTPWLSIYLHHLITSDEDRALHDHPWTFITVLLSSGYWEHTPAGRFWRRRFSILYRPAEWQHRLELERPTWTLVFRFRRRRLWGFIVGGRWIHWEKYDKEYCG